MRDSFIKKPLSPSPSLKQTEGFSVIGTVIAVALFVMIVVVIAPMFTAVNRAWDKDKRLKEQLQQARDAMDFITYELKKSNGIMDNRWNLDFSAPGLSTLDPNYVAFSSAGDEIVLDDKNSGYKSNGTVNSVAGTGFANDYDAADNTGYATYEFKTVAPGLYDVYTYFNATSGASALVGVFDDTCYDTIVADISSTFSQGSTNAGKWYQVNCSDAAFCTNQFGGAVRSLNLTAGGGTGGDCIGIKRTAGNNAIFDAFRLVYKGIRHKVFYLDTVNDRITYGNDVAEADGSYIIPANGENFDDSLASNATLLSNVTAIPGTDFLQYFDTSGGSITSAGNVALIKIAFQINDPTGNLSPYPLRAKVEIKQDPSAKRLVINEIFKQEERTSLSVDNFDGNSFGDGNNADAFVAGQADGNWYGFATNVDDVDGDGDNDLDMNVNLAMDNDAWLSATENFGDDALNATPTGWTAVDCADAGEQCKVGLDDGNSLFATLTTAFNDATEDNGGVFFYEASRNYVWVVDFKVPCNERQEIGFRMRHTDNTDHIAVEFYIDETGGTDVACLRVRREMNGAFANYPSGVEPECGSGGVKVALIDDNLIGDCNAAGDCDIYDDALWHRLVIMDVYYTASVWLSEGSATKAGLDALAPADFKKYLDTVNYDPAASRLDAYDVAGACGDAPCLGVKGFVINDPLNGTASDDNACPLGAADDPAQVRYDNMRIWSLDWKPVAYLTTFDDTNSVWTTVQGNAGGGGITQFYVYNPTQPTTTGNKDARGPSRDYTSGRYALDTGTCFVLREPGAARPEENYNADDAVELRTNALDLSQTTISTVGNVEFYYWLNTEDKHDAFIVQMSSSGGGNLAIPFTGVATQCVGKIKDGQTDTGSACVTGSDRIDPNYNSTVADASSTINTQRAFQSDNRSWRKVTAKLDDFVGTYSLLRFYWEADTKKDGTEYSGLYLDNIAVWYHWGGGIFEKTLERKSWRGYSNAGTNWGTSTPNYGTPGYFNSIAY